MQHALGLPERGWSCWAAGPEHASIYEPLESGGIPIVRLPFRGGNRHVLEGGRILRGLIRVMRRHRFDLLHARSNEGGVFGRMAGLATGVPAVDNPGGWTFDPAIRRGVDRVLALGIECLLAPCTSAFICVSESSRRIALEHGIGGASAINVVRNAAASCDHAVAPDPALERFSSEGPLAARITVLRPERPLTFS